MPFYLVEILAGLEMSNYKTKGMIMFEAQPQKLIFIINVMSTIYFTMVWYMLMYVVKQLLTKL